MAETVPELGRRLPGRFIAGIGAGTQVGIAAKPLQQLGLKGWGQLQIQAIGELNLARFARINAAFDQLVAPEGIGR